ncbi:MAG: hypothetical protein ACRDMX_05980 [Solirubrobacteraceae bacterium]
MGSGVGDRGGWPADVPFAGFCGQLELGWVILEARDPEAKGVLERSHRFMRSNFEPGRVFANHLDFQDRLDAWCEKANRRKHRTIRAIPVECLVEEKTRMRPLPAGGLPDTDSAHQTELERARERRRQRPDEIVNQVRDAGGYRPLERRPRLDENRAPESSCCSDRRRQPAAGDARRWSGTPGLGRCGRNTGASAVTSSAVCSAAFCRGR